MTQHNQPLRKRLARLHDMNNTVAGDFCVCGNYTSKCLYHKPGSDPILTRAADLAALIGEHHQIDYDSCETDEKAVIQDIAAYLREAIAKGMEAADATPELQGFGYEVRSK